MSEKGEVSSDEGDVPLKQVVNDSNSEKKSATKKNKKLAKKDSISNETTGESTSAEENEKSKKGKPRKKYYVEIEESGNRAVPLLDQPPVVEGSRQRRTVTQLNSVPEVVKPGSIPIPAGKGVPLGRIPIVSSRFKRLRLDEIKNLHRFMFGKLGDVNCLNNNILKFTGFPFSKDSPEYTRKLAALGKMNISILREFLLLFDLDLKIRKKEDVTKAILEFLVCPKCAETSVNPDIVSHPKRKATKRNYYEGETADDQKKQKKAKPSKAKEDETAKENGDSSSVPESAAEGAGKKKPTENEESKENNSGADNTNELKKPAKKRKRNQVIEEQPESTDDGRSKKNKSKETSDESAIENGSDAEIDTTENLSDDELKTFLKKVLADANLEKTTMKTVYSLISKHYPNYNFSKKKEFIKEVVKSAIQT